VAGLFGNQGEQHQAQIAGAKDAATAAPSATAEATATWPFAREFVTAVMTAMAVAMVMAATAAASDGHFEVVETAVKVSSGEHGLTRFGIEHGETIYRLSVSHNINRLI